jgi:hypothetical protein
MWVVKILLLQIYAHALYFTIKYKKPTQYRDIYTNIMASNSSSRLNQTVGTFAKSGTHALSPYRANLVQSVERLIPEVFGCLFHRFTDYKFENNPNLTLEGRYDYKTGGMSLHFFPQAYDSKIEQLSITPDVEIEHALDAFIKALYQTQSIEEDDVDIPPEDEILFSKGDHDKSITALVKIELSVTKADAISFLSMAYDFMQEREWACADDEPQTKTTRLSHVAVQDIMEDPDMAPDVLSRMSANFFMSLPDAVTEGLYNLEDENYLPFSLGLIESMLADLNSARSQKKDQNDIGPNIYPLQLIH